MFKKFRECAMWQFPHSKFFTVVEGSLQQIQRSRVETVLEISQDEQESQ